MELYILIDTATNLPLRLSWTRETEGHSYNTWEVPSFDLEKSDEHNQKYPIWTTSDKALAQKIADKCQDKTLKSLNENLDNPNCYLYTEGSIVVKTLIV